MGFRNMNKDIERDERTLEAKKKILETLRPLGRKKALRVLKAVAALEGIEI